MIVKHLRLRKTKESKTHQPATIVAEVIGQLLAQVDRVRRKSCVGYIYQYIGANEEYIMQVVKRFCTLLGARVHPWGFVHLRCSFGAVWGSEARRGEERSLPGILTQASHRETALMRHPCTRPPTNVFLQYQRRTLRIYRTTAQHRSRNSSLRQSRV